MSSTSMSVTLALGMLWEGRYRAMVTDSEPYLLSSKRYVEENPVQAGMVVNPAA